MHVVPHAAVVLAWSQMRSVARHLGIHCQLAPFVRQAALPSITRASPGSLTLVGLLYPPPSLSPVRTLSKPSSLPLYAPLHVPLHIAQSSPGLSPSTPRSSSTLSAAASSACPSTTSSSTLSGSGATSPSTRPCSGAPKYVLPCVVLSCVLLCCTCMRTCRRVIWPCSGAPSFKTRYDDV